VNTINNRKVALALFDRRGRGFGGMDRLEDGRSNRRWSRNCRRRRKKSKLPIKSVRKTILPGRCVRQNKWSRSKHLDMTRKILLRRRMNGIRRRLSKSEIRKIGPRNFR
jgi:hypothetical protein